jgi:hypothetical protein
VVGSPLHSVVNFSGCHLLRRLVGFLVHFSFGLSTTEHVVWRSECVWASAVTTAMIWCDISLIVLSKSLIRGFWVSFLRRWPKILLLILWWPQPSKSMLCTGL